MNSAQPKPASSQAHVPVSIGQGCLGGLQGCGGARCAFGCRGAPPPEHGDKPSRSPRHRSMGRPPTWRRCRRCRSRSTPCPCCGAKPSSISTETSVLGLREQRRVLIVDLRSHQRASDPAPPAPRGRISWNSIRSSRAETTSRSRLCRHGPPPSSRSVCDRSSAARLSATCMTASGFQPNARRFWTSRSVGPRSTDRSRHRFASAMRSSNTLAPIRSRTRSVSSLGRPHDPESALNTGRVPDPSSEEEDHWQGTRLSREPVEHRRDFELHDGDAADERCEVS